MTAVTIHQRALRFTIQVTRILATFPSTPELLIFRRQVIRSSSSVGANIIEAQNAASRKEFQKYVHIALRSARETEYWLTILVELIEKRGVLKSLLQENTEISRIIATILLNSKK